MKITAELLELSASFVNPLGKLQLDLRGNRIIEIENLFITRDGYEVIDLSDNDIEHLDNMPFLQNLKELYISRNSLTELKLEGDNLPNLSVLNLHGNKISNIEQISCLSKIASLKCLILTENPICYIDNYREKVLQTLPQLEILDYQPIYHLMRKVGHKIVANENGKSARVILDDLIRKAENAHDVNEIKHIEKLMASGFIK